LVKNVHIAASATEAGRAHDPEKWAAAFPRDKRERVCAEITLKQGDEITIRFNLIGS
jgi:hypothetical protein